MKTFIKIFFLFSLVFILGCASNVRSKKFTDDDFSKFKTFAYLPNTSLEVEGYNSVSDKSVEESLIITLNGLMIEKGYSIDTNNPDLLVLLSTSNEIKSNLKNQSNNYIRPQTEDTNYAGMYFYYESVTNTYYQRYLGNNDASISNRPYKKGTLLVQVFNKASKELIWVGIAEDFKAHISDQTLMTRMISEIFTKFPV